MLSLVVNERQDERDEHLPLVESTDNDSVSDETGVAPDEVHLGHFPRLPLTIVERRDACEYQSLERDQPEC